MGSDRIAIKSMDDIKNELITVENFVGFCWFLAFYPEIDEGARRKRLY